LLEALYKSVQRLHRLTYQIIFQVKLRWKDVMRLQYLVLLNLVQQKASLVLKQMAVLVKH